MEDYFLGAHQKELERLGRQHQSWLPETRQLIRDAGLVNCQSILDLGCGPGFTTFELANNCPAAQITALDKSELYHDYLDFLIDQRGTRNISTLRADILNLPAQQLLYDGAFCRWLLAFLIPDLPNVLKIIYDSLKPGGVFAAMEYLTLDSFTCMPANKSFTAYVKAWKDYYLINKSDANIGTYLPVLLEEAGFTIESQKCVGGMAPANHRWWNWWRDAFDDFAPVFVKKGLMTHEEFKDLEYYWKKHSESNTGFIYTAVILQTVARKEKE